MLRSIIASTLVMIVFAATQATAQNRGGYDPRSWTFDAQTGTVSPSGSGTSPTGDQQRTHVAEAARVIPFDENQPAGTVVVETRERALYYVLGNGQAIRYAVGVGREGFAWAGSDTVSAKREWPDWHPPAEMRQREAAQGRKLPVKVAGGPNNPMGARALYIGNTLYRIHGTNEPWTVGTANSSGCIRMTNSDVTDLYQRVKVGARVVVRH